MTRQAAARYIDDYLNGKGEPWAWEDFVHSRSTGEQDLDRIISFCKSVPEPPYAFGVLRMEQMVRYLLGESHTW